MATHARPQRCPLAPRGSQPWPTATREWPQPRSGGGIACGGGADRHGSLVADGQDNMVVRGIDAQCNWRGASGRELAGGAGWAGLRMVPSWFRLTYGAAVARIGRSGLRQGWAQPVRHMVGRGGPRRAGGAAQRRSCCSAGCERGEEERGGREKIEELTCGPTCQVHVSAWPACHISTITRLDLVRPPSIASLIWRGQAVASMRKQAAVSAKAATTPHRCRFHVKSGVEAEGRGEKSGPGRGRERGGGQRRTGRCYFLLVASPTWLGHGASRLLCPRATPAAPPLRFGRSSNGRREKVGLRRTLSFLF
uniref:Uncharacterized protein n=1 Tax=Setaria viridis TaxID=4556 RepID=A0A4U6TEA5_SETVI|nr:hypothetical protein SEVIR_8G113500v2 [Setaria viridis]